MVSAIEGEGLNVQEFNEIGEQARNDPELAGTLNQLIREELGG